MSSGTVDLKKEQEASLLRPRYPYSLSARFFFASMDLLVGKKTTLAKTKLIELLASIPYRAWEHRQYVRMTRRYASWDFVRRAFSVMNWSREAQDNEFHHLLVIEEKMKEDGVKNPWFLFPPIPWAMCMSYALMCYLTALFSIRRAFRFNGEFEDHAEHVYAQFVKDNPQWEDEPVRSERVDIYGQFDNWADVFRRIGLDERDHMNASFYHAGRPECIVHYQGMPPVEEPEASSE
ncbi:MAG: alternative oxidase [Pirellulaceae bacterium]